MENTLLSSSRIIPIRQELSLSRQVLDIRLGSFFLLSAIIHKKKRKKSTLMLRWSMTADYSTSFNQDETLSNRFNPDIQTMKCSFKSTYHAFSSDHSPPPLESAPLAALAQYEQWPYLWIPTQHLESWSCQIFCLAGHRQPNPVLDCGNWKQEPEKEGIFWIEQIGEDFLNIKENICWVPWGLLQHQYIRNVH